jgi:hypothetical protein
MAVLLASDPLKYHKEYSLALKKMNQEALMAHSSYTYLVPRNKTEFYII